MDGLAQFLAVEVVGIGARAEGIARQIDCICTVLHRSDKCLAAAGWCQEFNQFHFLQYLKKQHENPRAAFILLTFFLLACQGFAFSAGLRCCRLELEAHSGVFGGQLRQVVERVEAKAAQKHRRRAVEDGASDDLLAAELADEPEL